MSLIIAIGVFLLWCLVARLFPVTLTAIILVFFFVAAGVANGHNMSGASANLYAGIIVAAFGLDIN